ncbi:MAG TPA: hypothetical protein VMY42_14745 [Thermoguttaceae bacterium]|nr:hypothetical protein [Thermoguttaceae bacterium]
MSFSAKLAAMLEWNFNDGALDKDDLRYAKAFTDGDDDNEANVVWHDEAVTLTSGNSTTYDLTALTRTVLGETITHLFYLVKAVLIVVTSTTGGTLVVGADGSDEWSEPFGADGDIVKVPPDSPLLLANRVGGWSVDSSNKDLKVAASGGDVTYSIAIIGTITLGGSGS